MEDRKKIIKFNIDTTHRKQWFTGLSFSHPAKMSLPLQLWLVENFTKEGETILDPMAGSGTLLVACSLGRDVICVELETKFVDMMRGNWEKIQQRGPQMGYKMGDAKILCGDARNLTGILADKIITSPPFSDTTTYHDFKFMSDTTGDQRERLKQGLIKGHNASVEARKRALEKQASGIPEHPDNIANLPYGQGDSRDLTGILVDKVLFSPPFGEVSHHTDDAKDLEKFTPGRTGRVGGTAGNNEGNIGHLPYGSIDHIVSSPPYGNPRNTSEEYDDKYDLRRPKGVAWGRESFRGRYGETEGQIGDLPYGDISAIISSNYTSNADVCYNIGKCQLGFILELPNKEPTYHEDRRQSVPQVGQIKHRSQATESRQVSAKIVAVKLIDEQNDVNLVPTYSTELVKNYPKKVGNDLEKVIQSIGECLANDTQLLQELKCLLACSKVENLEHLLTNAIGIQLSGENGEPKCLSEINIPAKFAAQSLKGGKLYILSHTTFSQLLSILNSSLQSPTASLSAKTAITKLKVMEGIENSPTYLSAMLAVYKSCFSVLKPGGLMVLVVKSFIRNKKIVDLASDTIKLCEQAGFLFQDRWYRKLVSQSFWRTIYARRYPDAPAINFEDILLFVKKSSKCDGAMKPESI